MDGVLGALFIIFALDFAIQWLSCIISVFLQTEVFFDLVGTSTFTIGACVSLALGGSFGERQVMATTLVAVWATRLGTHLLMRVVQTGKDSRFDGVRNVPSMLFAFWTIQGMWIFLVLLPVVLLNLSQGSLPWWQPTDILGMCIWAAGFVLETAADYQKYFFKFDEGNKDKWIETGLWSMCRHPNYLGEMTLWWGVYVLCLGGLPSLALKAIGVISPLFTMWMLLFLSGVPLLEKAGERKWGEKPEYLKYLEDTPCIIPRLPWIRPKGKIQ